MVTTGLPTSALGYTDISHRDRKPTTGPLAPQPPPAEVPHPEVLPPPEPARTAWRNVTQRSARRGRRRSETVPPPATVPQPEMPQDSRLYAGSWATWNRKHLQHSLFPEFVSLTSSIQPIRILNILPHLPHPSQYWLLQNRREDCLDLAHQRNPWSSDPDIFIYLSNLLHLCLLMFLICHDVLLSTTFRYDFEVCSCPLYRPCYSSHYVFEKGRFFILLQQKSESARQTRLMIVHTASRKYRIYNDSKMITSKKTYN